MFNLATPSSVLQVVTGALVTSIECHATWVDLSIIGTTIGPGAENTPPIMAVCDPKNARDPWWLYEVDPTTVRSDAGEVSTKRCHLALEHVRGGSHVIAVQDGYLGVVHEVIHSAEGRIYLHRFVRFDRDFKVRSVSPSWTFEEGYGIEFCAGLARSPYDPSELVLAYGVKDHEAKLLVLKDTMLRRLDWIE